MTSETQTVESTAEQDKCWCCGRNSSQDALIRLGNHPEVGICINCVHSLRRQAVDRQAMAVRKRLRGAAESVRRDVMARGWHERPVIGPALKWVNQHLPW